jgi:RNA polymerase sigma-70 factor (ECF subfamily)
MRDTVPLGRLDEESRLWLNRLHTPGAVRGRAICELHERLRREAAFHVRRRARGLLEFPMSDIDDLATQAADDAMLAILRKLDDYRGDSQFWTWARGFAALEAPVSIRRRLGHGCASVSRDPDQTLLVPDPGRSLHDQAEMRDLLAAVSAAMRDELTRRQRTVLIETAMEGVPTDALADKLQTTPGAIYKALHDARVKLRLHVPEADLGIPS